jgi:hypothetical protein
VVKGAVATAADGFDLFARHFDSANHIDKYLINFLAFDFGFGG